MAEAFDKHLDDRKAIDEKKCKIELLKSKLNELKEQAAARTTTDRTKIAWNKIDRRPGSDRVRGGSRVGPVLVRQDLRQ